MLPWTAVEDATPNSGAMCNPPYPPGYVATFNFPRSETCLTQSAALLLLTKGRLPDLVQDRLKTGTQDAAKV